MIIPLLKGLATTLRMVFTKHITLQYPEVRRQVSPRWRGHPELTINEDGSRRCVACTLCMAVCPSNAIKGIVPDEGPDHEKYPIAFTIDLQRCIFCGFCQEACPKGAIKLNNLYELAQENKKMLILDIERATQSKSQLRLGDWL
ncbi:MAG: NADH-quinone oxidoreductase subunit I [Deltaproteobacteria bacterium]|jgi:NADH-quinone oxidoreductase subunit I